MSQETIVVEYVNEKSKFPKYSNGSVKTISGDWLSVGKGVEISSFKKGGTYGVLVSTNDKGYKSIESIVPRTSLPKTDVEDTVAPGGESPVRKARAKASTSEASNDSETMTKADWANKDRFMAMQAVTKSSLEAPGIQMALATKSDEEIFEFYAGFIASNWEAFKSLQ